MAWALGGVLHAADGGTGGADDVLGQYDAHAQPEYVRSAQAKQQWHRTKKWLGTHQTPCAPTSIDVRIAPIRSVRRQISLLLVLAMIAPIRINEFRSRCRSSIRRLA